MVVNRLYHRELIARLSQLEELEKKWNCKIIFPSTEQASDDVTISGPEWQVPHCVDEFLVSIISRRVYGNQLTSTSGHGPGQP